MASNTSCHRKSSTGSSPNRQLTGPAISNGCALPGKKSSPRPAYRSSCQCPPSALSGNGPHRSDRRPIHLDARRTDRPFEDHRPDSDQEPGHHLRDHALVVSIPVLQRSQLSFLLQLPHELLQKEHSGHEQPDRSVLHHYRQRIGQDGPGLLQ